MSWIKIAAHDIRCGLFRRRYLLVPALVIMECLSLGDVTAFAGLSPSFGDMMLYIFRGQDPNIMLLTALPAGWLLAMGGVLLFNLDYMLYDLTNAGQQVIVRSKSRVGWFLAKCLWNFLSTAMCFGIMCLTAAAITALFGGEQALYQHPELSGLLLGRGAVELDGRQIFMAGILTPFLSLAALNMLQMALCLFLKPVVSFLVCQAQLILTIFWQSPFCLGEGAMAMRSGWVRGAGSGFSGINTVSAAIFAAAALAVCVTAGAVKFAHADILGLEE